MKMLYLKNSFSKTSFLILISMVLLSTEVSSQEHAVDSSKAMRAHTMLLPADLVWADAPPGLPPGAKVAVLDGDPSKVGLFSLRIKFPANYTIQAHWHPTAENVTVLSGTFLMGMGDKFDDKKLKTLSAGSYAMMPANTNHFAMSKGETIVQLHGMGPFKINYINPADDPRNKK